MSLLSLNEVSLRYSAHILLDCAYMSVEESDRLAIIGRNGCGKTTLLKIIAGIIPQDSGLVESKKGLKVAYMPQEVPTDLSGSVYSVIAGGLGDMGRHLARYKELLAIINLEHTKNQQEEFDNILHKLEADNAWSLDSKISETIDRLELDASLDVATLSAGLKRRVLLGRELVCNPDILLLDEPTNHLDIDSVIWLEKFLKTCGKTLVFVSHDREFLQNLANRVVEVDRGRLISFDCSFKEFLKRKEDLLKAEEQNNMAFDKKLAKEEAWLRQGVKARRTRNEGRVRNLLKLREFRRVRRNVQGVAKLQIQSAIPSGEKVLDVKNLNVSYAEKSVIKDFSTTIFGGDKIGIVGRNGVGKTTLLNALLGKIAINSGEVVCGTKLQIAYFDQLRQTLDPKMRLFEFVGEGSDFIEAEGQKQNVMGYLQNFLFEPEQIRGEIAALSGGEKNRLLLAKLFTRPANVLVLDEPTNDLDIETLEILESALVNFAGTILLVSHDRAFLNNIVTGLFCFEDDGKIIELVGGYDDWENYRNQKQSLKPTISEKPKVKAQEPKRKEKLNNKERAELEAIPSKIKALEDEEKEISEKLQDVEFLTKNAAQISTLEQRIEEIRKEDETLFERWDYLLGIEAQK